MKRYTASEMRGTADALICICGAQVAIDAVAMLRQAADMMESKKKRERKFEYTVKYEDGEISSLHYCLVDPLKHGKRENHRIIRREVGGWEEVKDEEV